jgi:glycosyltransferase involved in cell wall biosynthesis
METVAVVVPCYGYGHFLNECVESVLTQSFLAVRVLIIDDCSPDNTFELATALAQRDSRVTVIRHATNLGNIATYNEGIDWASSDYFLLLSADDYLLPGAIQRAVEVLAENPDVVLTCGKAAVSDQLHPVPTIPAQPVYCSYRVLPGQTFIRNACDNAWNAPLWTPTAIVRTAIQKDIGGYNKNLSHTADLEMWLRFACRGSIADLDAYQAVYREHGANMHHSFDNIGNLKQHFLAFYSAFAKDGTKILNVRQGEHRYRKSLAVAALALTDVALLERNKHLLDDCISFATTICPDIRTSRSWYEVLLKRLIGVKTINAAKRFTKLRINSFRGAHKI